MKYSTMVQSKLESANGNPRQAFLLALLERSLAVVISEIAQQIINLLDGESFRATYPEL
jgi:hypothetical protein